MVAVSGCVFRGADWRRQAKVGARWEFGLVCTRGFIYSADRWQSRGQRSTAHKSPLAWGPAACGPRGPSGPVPWGQAVCSSPPLSWPAPRRRQQIGHESQRSTWPLLSSHAQGKQVVCPGWWWSVVYLRAGSGPWSSLGQCS